MQEWFKIGKTAVFSDKSKGGLFNRFLIDYKEHFKTQSINPNCHSCIEKYWNDYLNTLKMENKNNCDYELHKKYSGSIVFNNNPVINEELTNEIAEELIKNHPRGVLLFARIPDKKEVLAEIEQPTQENPVQEVPKKIKRNSKKRK